MSTNTEKDCPVIAAIKYAEEIGDGYELSLILRNGDIFRGPIYAPKNGVIEIRREGKNRTFVRLTDVVAATVEW